jgi:hypothetical protein
MKKEGIHHKGTEDTKADTKNINVRRKPNLSYQDFLFVSSVPLW